jgi:hypothetical protein
MQKSVPLPQVSAKRAVCPCSILHDGFVVLSHNVLRGTALLDAELMAREGLIEG